MRSFIARKTLLVASLQKQASPDRRARVRQQLLEMILRNERMRIAQLDPSQESTGRATNLRMARKVSPAE
jgi:hypothetical protein